MTAATGPDSRPHILIIGGGAAGFFAAITCAEARPEARVTVLERSAGPLAKVRVSGGGRCNVTHDLPDPAQFVTNYPRGSRALRGPLSRFGVQETVSWFAERGVALKTETDGRMFPESNTSETVVDCLLGAAGAANVKLRTGAAVRSLTVPEDSTKVGTNDRFTVTLKNGETMTAERVLLATGSNPQVHTWVKALGHEVVPPVPSLFTFKVDDPRIAGLAGLSVPDAEVTLEGARLVQRGPLLVTHWGLSGPAVLKLSAWGARELHGDDYRTTLRVNWLPELRPDAVREGLRDYKDAEPRKTVASHPLFGFPGRLWASLVQAAGLAERWADVSKAQLARFANELQHGHFEVTGKGVFKEEFVTCGGVNLKEVNFRTMESRVCSGLYFAGELLDVDGVTGGFNFQNAWATGYLAGQAVAESVSRSKAALS